MEQLSPVTYMLEFADSGFRVKQLQSHRLAL